jgi:hypothetical protein
LPTTSSTLPRFEEAGEPSPFRARALRRPIAGTRHQVRLRRDWSSPEDSFSTGHAHHGGHGTGCPAGGRPQYCAPRAEGVGSAPGGLVGTHQDALGAPTSRCPPLSVALWLAKSGRAARSPAALYAKVCQTPISFMRKPNAKGEFQARDRRLLPGLDRRADA